MEDGRWLRFLTIGLVLAALVVGYFIVTGRFATKQITPERTEQVETITPGETEQPVLGEDTTRSQASLTPQSAYDRIAERNKAGVSELPKTGFPLFMTGLLAASAMIAGWGLRKFPK